METPKDSRSAAGLAVGIGLVALGSWLFLRESGIVPSFVFSLIDRVAWPITLIVIGVAVIVVAQRVHAPVSGARLTRSRSDRWVAGVLGGLGRYFGIDPVILRIAFIVLAVVGQGGPVIAYIIAAVLLPEEPVAQPSTPAA